MMINPLFAQNDLITKSNKSHSISIDIMKNVPIKKVYFNNALDGMILSTALIDRPNGSSKSGTLRFSTFFHIGCTVNYNLSQKIGVYTGADIKNIGFIEKDNGFTYKKRVYTFGVPLGLRLGNMNKRNYIFMGGGLDLALNYKEKLWSKDIKKSKFSEWFGKETDLIMPYVFAGYTHKGISLKVQYYPNNFLNQDYTRMEMGVPTKIFAGTKVNLLLLSLGLDIDWHLSK
jgi:hypothetical protein